MKAEENQHHASLHRIKDLGIALGLKVGKNPFNQKLPQFAKGYLRERPDRRFEDHCTLFKEGRQTVALLSEPYRAPGNKPTAETLDEIKKVCQQFSLRFAVRPDWRCWDPSVEDGTAIFFWRSGDERFEHLYALKEN